MIKQTDIDTPVADDDPRLKERVSIVAIAGQIVAAFVSKNQTTREDLPAIINEVVAAIDGQVHKDVSKAPHAPVDTRQTVFPDYIISLEDGKPYKTLKRHLRKFNMSPEDYRRKWNLPHDYPMVAENYSKARSQMAKDTGLGSARHLRAVA